MLQIPEDWCSHEETGCGPTAPSEHHAENFIPTGWALEYDTLNGKGQKRFLYIIGRCLHCRKSARTGVSIPSELTGDALFEKVYEEQRRYRPFAEHHPQTGAYFGKLEMRLKWYQQQDDLPVERRNEQFVQLFHTEDQEAARLWVSQHHAAEEYTRPQRDRTSTLFYATLAQARADGCMAEIDPILDYILPNEHEPEEAEHDTFLTDYRFNVVPAVQYGGSEGIFVDLYLDGKCDAIGYTRHRIGVFKTLRSDLDACKRMGELCGVLLHYATAHVDQNIHRYTPESELIAEEARRMRKGDSV